jgi:hypothetical protein
MKLVEEMREYAGRLPPAHSDLAINEWADRLEAIAKAQGESVVVDGAPLYTASQCTPVARDMQESGGDE